MILIGLHPKCISDTVSKMYHDTWYLILFLYQDTYHDTCIIELILPNTVQYIRHRETQTNDRQTDVTL